MSTSTPSTTTTTTTSSGFALLIGIEEYEHHKERNLRAGRNDVLAYWKVCRRLGYRAENIRVLTTPVLTKQDILWAEMELYPESNKGEVEGDIDRWFEAGGFQVATEKKLLDGADWLARSLSEVLVHPDTLKDVLRGSFSHILEYSPGILAYSGHGAQVGGELVLCPSDVDGELTNAVSTTELRKRFNSQSRGGHQLADNLTVLLDCCFAGAGASDANGRKVSSLPAPGPRAELSSERKEISSRVFCASGRDENAYQAVLGGYWYSAFTWALTVALEQWTITPERSDISHTELLFRTRTLLHALSFPQRPILAHDIATVPMFRRASAGRSGTSREPTAERPGGQLDPSSKDYAYYQIKDPNGTVLVEVISANTANGSFKAQTEYWKFNSGKTTIKTSDYESMTITKESRCWSVTAPFEARDQSWDFTVAAFWATGQFTQNDCQAYGSYYGLYLDASSSWSKWSGTLKWFRPSSDTGNMFCADGTYVLCKTNISAELKYTSYGL